MIANSVSGVLILDAASVLGKAETVEAAPAPDLSNPMIMIKGWPFVLVTI